MRPGWVAGGVRARLLLDRRLGREAALGIAALGSLDAALARLAGTAYGRALEPGLELERAQRRVFETALWHLRVLAGWLPPGGAEMARALAGWFELVNIEERLAYLEGGVARPPFELGSLATAWSRAAEARSPAELRAILATSRWGDPGGEGSTTVRRGLRLAWARWLLADVPETTAWVTGAVALTLAADRLVAGRPPEELVPLRLPGIGSGWETAASPGELGSRLPSNAAWALEGVARPEDVWRGEVAWWRRVAGDAAALVRQRPGRPVVVGAVALLAVDAHLVSGALGAAARGGGQELVEELAGLG